MCDLKQIIEPIMVPRNKEEVEQKSKKYKIFGCLHVEKLTKVICWLGLILLAYNSVSSFVNVGISVNLINGILGTFVYGIALYGIENTKPSFLIATLIVKIINLIVVIVNFVLFLNGIYFFSIIYPKVYASRVFAVRVLGNFLEFYIFYRCYESIREKKIVTNEAQLPVTYEKNNVQLLDDSY